MPRQFPARRGCCARECSATYFSGWSIAMRMIRIPVWFTLGALALGVAQAEPPEEARKTGVTPMNLQAKGTFEVSLAAQSLADAAAGEKLGRMSIDKRFSGDLVGTGKGEMLSAMTDTRGSAGYVAIERVEGSLNGRKGSFVLQHSGVMTRGAPQLSVTVVPDSATGELTGLTGTLKIDIVERKHFYDFQYSLPK
jgi:hypothetical protein